MRLRNYVLIRILLILPMILLLATVVFVVMRVIPGDPVVALFGGGQGSEANLAAIRHSLGLDKPLYVQYFEYLANLAQGNFGVSLVRQSPVLSELMNAFPATLELTLFSALFALPLGIYFGTAAAKRAGSKLDTAIRIGSLIRWCVPAFWLGIMFQILAVYYLPGFPVSGRLSPRTFLQKITGLNILDSLLTANPSALLDSALHLLFPVLTLGSHLIASLTRLTRANMIEVLGEEYIKVVTLKGSTEARLFSEHVLPNALIPILTYAGLEIALLMGGAIITETVFSWPGLGRLLFIAVSTRDFTLIQGCIVFFAFVVSSVNLAVDILYAIIDPRVRY